MSSLCFRSPAELSWKWHKACVWGIMERNEKQREKDRAFTTLVLGLKVTRTLALAVAAALALARTGPRTPDKPNQSAFFDGP